MPPFLHRTLVLLEARRALARGAPERALELLRDPAVASSEAARGLRSEALDGLHEDLGRRARAGRETSFFRLLAVAAREDPARAARWRSELSPWSRRAPATSTADGPSPADPGPGPPGRDEPGLDEPGLDEPALDRAPSALDALLGRAGAEPPGPGPALHLRFLLAVDDGGEFLVVAGDELTLGHSRGGRAQVPFLADLDSEQALLRRRESFHGGSTWFLVPRAAPAEVDGRPVPVDGERALTDGSHVRLSPRVEFRFRLPEPASASALLELLHGAEAEGAGRVLLLVRGVAGRVRIGPRERRHVPVADLEHEVELRLEDPGLVVRCAGGVRIEGLGRNPGPPTTNKTVPCPPPARIDLTVNARPSRRPPFGLCLRPLEGSNGSLPGTDVPPGA